MESGWYEEREKMERELSDLKVEAQAKQERCAKAESRNDELLGHSVAINELLIKERAKVDRLRRTIKELEDKILELKRDELRRELREELDYEL